VTARATFRQADPPSRPPDAVLEAAREIGRLLARRALENVRDAAEPRAIANPRP